MSFEDEIRLAMAAKSVELDRRAPDVSEIERRASQPELAPSAQTEREDDQGDDKGAVILLPAAADRTAIPAPVRATSPRSARLRSRLAQSSVGLVAAAAVIAVIALVTLGQNGSQDTDVFISPADQSDPPALSNEADDGTDEPGESSPDANQEVQIEQVDASDDPPEPDEAGSTDTVAPTSTATPSPTPTAEANDPAVPAPVAATATPEPTPLPNTDCPDGQFRWADGDCYPIPETTPEPSPTDLPTPTPTPLESQSAPTATPTAVPTATATTVPAATPSPTPEQDCPTGEFRWVDGQCYPIPALTPTATATPSAASEGLQCPSNATEVNGECREAIAMIPGPKTCPDPDYAIVDGQCVIIFAQTVEHTCPIGTLVTQPSPRCAVTEAAVDFDEATDQMLCRDGTVPSATQECTYYESTVVNVVCPQNGQIVGATCVVYGSPPTAGPATCPTGPGIVADPCYRVVDPL